MRLTVIREEFGKDFTIGRLLAGGRFFCWTLEDKDRRVELGSELKIHKATAIPIGEYKVIINESARFKKDMPLLLDVPYFSGVRIHSGNTHNDTEGCILVGKEKHSDRIGRSREAFNELMSFLKVFIRGGEQITIEIKRSVGKCPE